MTLIEPFSASDSASRLCDTLKFDHYFCSDSNKIWVFWRAPFGGVQLIQSDPFLHFQFNQSQSLDSFYCTFVYGKHTRAERRLLWAELLALRTAVGNHPWFLAGDFNAILSADEYMDPSIPDAGSIQDFNRFFGETDLRELPVSGGVFTWTGVRRPGRVWSKLDRMLFNSSWLHSFPTGSVELLSRLTSDHNPLLYSSSCDRPQGLRSFRFQNFWTGRPDFLELVQANWALPVSGYGMYRFAVKLRRLKFALRAWNHVKVGNILEKARAAELRVKELEEIFQSSQDPSDLSNLNQAQAHLLSSLREEESFWKQKARLKWHADGDRNTRLYHAMVAARRSRLTIAKMKDAAGN